MNNYMKPRMQMIHEDPDTYINPMLGKPFSAAHGQRKKPLGGKRDPVGDVRYGAMSK